MHHALPLAQPIVITPLRGRNCPGDIAESYRFYCARVLPLMKFYAPIRKRNHARPGMMRRWQIDPLWSSSQVQEEPIVNTVRMIINKHHRLPRMRNRRRHQELSVPGNERILSAVTDVELAQT